MYIYISKFCLPFKKKNTPHKLLSLLLNNPKKKKFNQYTKEKKNFNNNSYLLLFPINLSFINSY